VLFKPFKALRPVSSYVSKVISPPYDVVSSAEARQMALGNDMSFLHIAKPEIDFSESIDQYSPLVYQKGADNLQRLVNDGILKRDEENSYYVYRITMKNHVQTGIAGLVSAREYRNGRVRKHEFTLPIKEDDRYNQIMALQAQTGPVLLTYHVSEKINLLLNEITVRPSLYKVMGPYKTIHEIWIVRDEKIQKELMSAFDSLSEMYIADGHHRMAAGSRVAEAMKKKENSGDDDKYDGILAVAFADNEMQVLPYNRVIRDLNGQTLENFINLIEDNGFDVEPVSCRLNPCRRMEFGMYAEKKWYRLRYIGTTESDPVSRLDVSILSDNVFNRLLGIKDLRNDKRIAFIGGIRGLSELEKKVDGGEFKAAFSLFATPVEDLIDVAKSGHVMPPKSTWFEPKLADGLLSNVF